MEHFLNMTTLSVEKGVKISARPKDNNVFGVKSENYYLGLAEMLAPMALRRLYGGKLQTAVVVLLKRREKARGRRQS